MLPCELLKPPNKQNDRLGRSERMQLLRLTVGPVLGQVPGCGQQLAQLFRYAHRAPILGGEERLLVITVRVGSDGDNLALLTPGGATSSESGLS